MVRTYVPDIGGVSMESLMASAVARMVRKKSEIFAALLVSSRFFIHWALRSVADGLPRCLYLKLDTSSSSACWFGMRHTLAYREISE